MLNASARTTPEQEKEFALLVDAASGQITPHVASVLMHTFSDASDFGTQEAVCSALASGAPRVTLCAILEEMPRLSREAPEWAESLLCTELEHRIQLVLELLHASSVEVRAAVRSIIIKPEFVEFQPKALLLQKALHNAIDA